MNNETFLLILTTLAIIMIVAMAFIFYNYRMKEKLRRTLEIKRIREEEHEKVRRNMARDFHDNMGNQLASITVFTSLISLKLNNRDPEIDQYLEGIKKHSRSLFNGTKDFIWSMDPDTDNLDEVFTYLKDFGEDLFEKSGIEFYSEKTGDVERVVALPTGCNRQIVLIFKEAMTNTFKHSQATTCHFLLNLNWDNYVLTFKDNGKGLPSTVRENGLKNIRKRASDIQCRFDLKSSEEGVTISLSGVSHMKSIST